MNRLTLQLAALAVLAFVLWQATIQAWDAMAQTDSLPPVRTAASTTRPGAPDSRVTVPGLKNQTLASYAQTLSRPLFFEGRRFPEREITAKAAPVAGTAAPVTFVALNGVTLKGIAIGGGAARAMVEIGPQPANWISVGDKVQAWTVDTILANTVMLKQGPQSAKLELYAPGALK